MNIVSEREVQQSFSSKLHNPFAIGIFGGLFLLLIQLGCDGLVHSISPYNIFDIPGSRPISDPLMLLFFVHPFLISIIIAFFWSHIRTAFTGSLIRQTVHLGGYLIFLIVIPDIWIIYTTMLYPPGFYLSQIISGCIGYLGVALLNVYFSGEKRS